MIDKEFESTWGLRVLRIAVEGSPTLRAWVDQLIADRTDPTSKKVAEFLAEIGASEKALAERVK